MKILKTKMIFPILNFNHKQIRTPKRITRYFLLGTFSCVCALRPSSVCKHDSFRTWLRIDPKKQNSTGPTRMNNYALDIHVKNNITMGCSMSEKTRSTLKQKWTHSFSPFVRKFKAHLTTSEIRELHWIHSIESHWLRLNFDRI